MKIAFLADPLDTQYAGIHVFCKELLYAIDQLKSVHEIFVFRANKADEFVHLKEVVFPIKKALLIHHRARLFTSIPKFIKQNNFDIVVELAHFGPFGLPESIQQVTYIHDLTPITHKRFHGVASQKLHQLLLPKILKKSNLILCNSSQTQNDIRKFADGVLDKTEVIPLGFNNQYKPSFDTDVISKWGITKPFILHVGTLEPRKNIPFLLAAFEDIKQLDDSTDFQLVLTGKPGWEYQEILSAIEQSNFKEDIILTDYVPQEVLPVFYTHAECLVLPSHYEGFGLPVLEAMACGCPCLISGEGALSEVAGDAAMYFDISDSSTLVDKIQNILGNQQLQLDWRQKSLQHASKYSWENTARAFIESLEKLAVSS